jgi:hypothetical protein
MNIIWGTSGIFYRSFFEIHDNLSPCYTNPIKYSIKNALTQKNNFSRKINVTAGIKYFVYILSNSI